MFAKHKTTNNENFFEPYIYLFGSKKITTQVLEALFEDSTQTSLPIEEKNGGYTLRFHIQCADQVKLSAIGSEKIEIPVFLYDISNFQNSYHIESWADRMSQIYSNTTLYIFGIKPTKETKHNIDVKAINCILIGKNVLVTELCIADKDEAKQILQIIGSNLITQQHAAQFSQNYLCK